VMPHGVLDVCVAVVTHGLQTSLHDDGAQVAVDRTETKLSILRSKYLTQK
jgi:hypothetical protein